MGKRESQAVYRRRRIVAAIVILLPVLIVAKACASQPTRISSTPPTPSFSLGALDTATATETATDTTTAKAETTTATTIKAKPDTTTATPKASAKPSIGDCSNTDIQVTITADAESYVIGSPVTMAMRIANVGSTDCKRDVGALSNEIYVTNIDGAVVWSSDACQVAAKPQIATMHPGSVFGNTQVWGGRNSGRDCSSAAPDAAPGSYLAYARNDTVSSKAFAFTIE